MANWEMWDVLSAVTPDYSDTKLDVRPSTELLEEGDKNQEVLVADDDSDTIITLSSTSVFYVELTFENITEAEAGTIMDMYHNTNKANGKARSFLWKHYGEASDPHEYTVRFDRKPKRVVSPPLLYSVRNVRLKILGKAPAE